MNGGDAQALTRALGGKWYGRYGLALCPAHGDRRPSLSLSNAPNGRLLARCHVGCGFTDILGALRDLGLLDCEGVPRLDPAEVERREAEAEREAAKKEKQARMAWDEAQPIAGTPAETYLRGRGISAPLPDTLRFAPDCWHPAAKRFPAMVARVDGGARFAVHRTYLDPDGNGKAAIEPAKAMLGLCRGGAVRLAEGDGPLHVCEGA
ncbi:MAG: hypothetical protein OIF40_08730 [Mangrovicoccus sp.]|nr:hypothetical protein [Mangrovicoccus sp.]